MFNQLFKRSTPPVRHKLELISIHIPKTAGTSFRNSLEGVYGKEEVIRLDIGLVRQEVRVWEALYDADQLPPRTKVVHGHFSYPLLTRHFEIDPSIPVITWLRDPVKRVVSNYLYLAKRLAEELKEEERGLNILKKMQRSLIEYASYEPSQNRMTRFLEGLDLERMAFVGLVESYDEDLAHLATRLDWTDYPVFHYNQTGKNSGDISERELDLIRSLNQEDIRLYERAQELRAKGHWST